MGPPVAADQRLESSCPVGGSFVLVDAQQQTLRLAPALASFSQRGPEKQHFVALVGHLRVGDCHLAPQLPAALLSLIVFSACRPAASMRLTKKLATLALLGTSPPRLGQILESGKIASTTCS